MTTTKDEETQKQRDDEELVVAKSVTKKDVVAGYNSGKNYYTLAQEFFGFQSDDAVARIRQIIEDEVAQN